MPDQKNTFPQLPHSGQSYTAFYKNSCSTQQEVFKAEFGFVNEKALKEVYEEVHQGSATLTSFGKLEIAG